MARRMQKLTCHTHTNSIIKIGLILLKWSEKQTIVKKNSKTVTYNIYICLRCDNFKKYHYLNSFSNEVKIYIITIIYRRRDGKNQLFTFFECFRHCLDMEAVKVARSFRKTKEYEKHTLLSKV